MTKPSLMMPPFLFPCADWSKCTSKYRQNVVYAKQVQRFPFLFNFTDHSKRDAGTLSEFFLGYPASFLFSFTNEANFAP